MPRRIFELLFDCVERTYLLRCEEVSGEEENELEDGEPLRERAEFENSGRVFAIRVTKCEKQYSLFHLLGLRSHFFLAARTLKNISMIQIP